MELIEKVKSVFNFLPDQSLKIGDEQAIEKLPYIYYLFLKIKEDHFENEFFFKSIHSESNIEFIIPSFSYYPLIIYRKNFHEEDPPLYIRKEDKEILLSQTSSIVFLTELVFWIYEKSKYKFCNNGVVYIYPTLRQHFHLLAKSSDYPKKIWIDEQNQNLALVSNMDEKIYFISGNRNSFSKLSSLFGFQQDKPGLKSVKKFSSDLILNGRLKNSTVEGDVYIRHLKRIINVSFELDFEYDLLAMELFIKQSIDVIELLTKRKVKEIIYSISKEITDISLNQKSMKLEIDLEINKLVNDLVLGKIDFIENDIILVFNSLNIFKDNKIFVQVDSNFNVLDITIGA